MTTEPTAPADIEALAVLLEAAHDEVVRLCTPGETWRMGIPANPSRDSDLILSDALTQAIALLAEVKASREERARVEALAEAAEARENASLSRTSPTGARHEHPSDRHRHRDGRQYMHTPPAEPVAGDVGGVSEAAVGDLVHARSEPLECGWFIVGDGGYFDVDNAMWVEDEPDNAPWTTEWFDLFGRPADLAARTRMAAEAGEKRGAERALRELADDIDVHGYGWTSVVEAARFVDRLRARADRIAGES